MKIDELKSKISELIYESKDTPLTPSDIGKRLELRGADRKRLQKALHQLTMDGSIVEIRGGRYTLGEEADLVTGLLKTARNGRGYLVNLRDPRALTIAPEAQGTALPGDRVVVRLQAGAPTGPADRIEAKVIRILERARRDVVGTLTETSSFLVVIPLNPAYRQNFYVPSAEGAKPGDRVVVRFTEWRNRHVSPEGIIVEVIGPADDASTDTVSIMRQYGFEPTFPSDVLDEAESVSALMEHPGEREDLRDGLILTIDPARARDFDDALSLNTDAEGNRILGVHIADVSHYVRPGSALDREASRRGNSVYLPDRVVPMLPEQLSNGVCSLRPDEDRLAFSAFLTLDGRGTVIKRRFSKTSIRSKHRLTYEEAMALIDPALAPEGAVAPELPKDAVRLLKQLHRLAQQLRKSRFAKYALDLEVPECDFVLGADGMIAEVRPVHHDPSHQLVEECMIAANEAVAFELRNRGKALIARYHAPPKSDRIEALTALLIGMGYQPGDLSRPRHMSRFLASIKDDPMGHVIRVEVLKSMNRAVYSADDIGHFGLAKRDYSHFTSPIRRYPDLILHRQLEALAGTGGSRKRDPYVREALRGLALHCSFTEQEAEEGERALSEIKKYRYLARQVEDGRPKPYEAIVVQITNFGLFAEIMDLQVQGLVHISGLSDTFVRYDRKNDLLRAGKTTYRRGQKIRVHVAAVDFDKRRLDLAIHADA